MDKITNTMIKEALKVLPNAYAPYSKFKVSCCVQTDQGNLYTGVNVENASYGLTVCAEVSTICQMVAAGEQKIQSVVILAATNLICPPCGSCRQIIHEFSTPDTLVHLCNKDSVFKSLTINELLPLAFNL